MKKIINVPEYFKNLPDDARLEYKEVMAVTGIKNRQSLGGLMKSGALPRSDHKIISRSRGAVCYWKVKTIREWIENVNRNIPK